MTDRGTAVAYDVTNDEIELHVMLEGGPPYTLTPEEARALADDLQIVLVAHEATHHDLDGDPDPSSPPCGSVHQRYANVYECDGRTGHSGHHSARVGGAVHIWP